MLNGQTNESSTARNSPDAISPLLIRRPQGEIQHDVRAHDLQKLWAHVEASWDQLGREDPFHSVLTSEKYKSESIKDNIEEFWRTGDYAVSVVRDICTASDVDYGSYATCLDYGTGVGRVAMKLAETFDTVHAADISNAHLNIARERATELSVSNIKFHIANKTFLDALPRFDFFYSSMVFQHSPPPIMRFILEKLISKLAPGGAAVFQIPIYMNGYSFNADEYLADRQRGMEMHCLPQSEVFSIIRSNGARLRQVREDKTIGGIGRWVSNTICIVKE